MLQDFFIKTGSKRSTLQLSLGIINMGNLLDSDWGVYKIPNRSARLLLEGMTPAECHNLITRILNAAAKTSLTETFRDETSGLLSRGQMKLGVRYIFN